MMHQHGNQGDGQSNKGMSPRLMAGGFAVLLLLAGLFLSLGGSVSVVVAVFAGIGMLFMHSGMMGGHKGH